MVLWFWTVCPRDRTQAGVQARLRNWSSFELKFALVPWPAVLHGRTPAIHVYDATAATSRLLPRSIERRRAVHARPVQNAMFVREPPILKTALRGRGEPSCPYMGAETPFAERARRRVRRAGRCVPHSGSVLAVSARACHARSIRMCHDCLQPVPAVPVRWAEDLCLLPRWWHLARPSSLLLGTRWRTKSLWQRMGRRL